MTPVEGGAGPCRSVGSDDRVAGSHDRHRCSDHAHEGGAASHLGARSATGAIRDRAVVSAGMQLLHRLVH